MHENTDELRFHVEFKAETENVKDFSFVNAWLCLFSKPTSKERWQQQFQEGDDLSI